MVLTSLLSPDHLLAINLVPALVAPGLGDRHLSLVAPGTLVGVQQELALLAHCDSAVRAGCILQLEIPLVPAVRAVVVGHHDDPVFNNISLRRRVTPGAERLFAMKGRQASCQERDRR